jgi:hypothetical protein
VTERPATQDEPNTSDTAQDEPTARDKPATRADTDSGPAQSTELVVRRTAAPVARARRWPHAVAGLGRRLPQVLRHPAAVASASVAATVATRLLVSGLRQAARPAASTRGDGTDRAGAGGPITVAGYVLHEVHVIHHHVVHHYAVHRAARPPLP